jgi:DNA-binding response OmpR family regulator
MLAEEILMVNDGSLLLKLMGSLLESKGYHLSLTDSPEEALVLLSTRNVVLAVLKLNGRQTDRLAVAHLVKELNDGTDLVIVGESTDLPAEIFEIDADDYILLPCRAVEIWRRLLFSLEAAHLQPARSPAGSPGQPPDRPSYHRSRAALPSFNRRGRLDSINSGRKPPRPQSMDGQKTSWRQFGLRTLRNWILGLPADTEETPCLGKPGSP